MDLKHDLQERVKELTALHGVARLIQDDVRDECLVLADIVALLPPAWQYPDATSASIRWEDHTVSTDGFAETPWLQRAAFSTNWGHSGEVVVAYDRAFPEMAEGPFLVEERHLIDSLADLLRAFLERRRAQNDLQRTNERLEQLVAERTADLTQANLALQEEVDRRKEAQAEIMEKRCALRRLASELSLAEERERRKIATDLHDNLGQALALVRMRLTELQGNSVFCGFEEDISELRTLLNKIIRYVRTLTFELSTPLLYELGLPAALEWLGEHELERYHIAAKIEHEGTAPILDEDQKVTLFKCCRELLRNVVRHARATEVTMRLTSEAADHVELTVADDGVGFVPTLPLGDGTTFGLFSVRERLRALGGRMRIDSAPGEGTTITLGVVRRERNASTAGR